MKTLSLLSAREQPMVWSLQLLLLASAVTAISFGAVNMPWLTAGVVLGAAILAIALAAPLAFVALMLIIGPLDLSFITGGFKSLFPELGGLDMNGIRLLGGTAGFIVFVAFEPRARAAAASYVGRPWIVFLLFAAFTLGFSMDRLEGLRFLLKLAWPFLVFLVVIGLADTQQRLGILTRFTLLAALVYTVIINPILVANGGFRYELDGSLRVSGLGAGENPYAFYCTALLMFTTARAVIRRSVGYVWFSVVLVLWIAATGSRIAALAAMMGIATVGLLTAWVSGNRKILAATLAGLGLAAAVFMPIVLRRSLGFIPTPIELLELAASPTALINSINWQGRQVIWALLWGAFLTSPLWGLGLGSVTPIMRGYFGERGLDVAHNEYLRLVTETGLVGLLLFMIALGMWLLAAIRISRQRSHEVQEFAVAAAALVIAWMVIAVTDNAINYYNNLSQYLGFLMAGAVVAQTSTERAVNANAQISRIDESRP